MKHYREIDILRGIAIIMVFLGHVLFQGLLLDDMKLEDGKMYACSAHVL